MSAKQKVWRDNTSIYIHYLKEITNRCEGEEVRNEVVEEGMQLPIKNSEKMVSWYERREGGLRDRRCT